MAKVKNLSVKIQSGTTSTLYALWYMNTQTSTTTSSAIKVGTKVSIKSGATYYNGVDVPDWIEAKQWVVSEVSGDRVVIDKSVDGNYSICSPINSKYLTVVGSSSSSTVETDTLDHYIVTWNYRTADGVWFNGSSSTTTYNTALYDIPSNAVKVRCFVKPVSKTYKVTVDDKEEERSYWTGVAVYKDYTVPTSPPETPSGLSVSIDGYTLTAVVEGIEDAKADRIYFEVIRDSSDNTTYKFKTGYCDVKYQRASFSCKIVAGFCYRVRCRAAYGYKETYLYSDWTTYTSQESTVPLSTGPVRCKVISESSVKLSWTASATATSYDIEYSTDSSYFDISSEVSSTSTENNEILITGIDSGHKWYFRVRSVNSKGNSTWSPLVTAILGSTPSAPTTWSNTSTGMVTDTITLYWVHNAEDGSAQTAAEICLKLNDSALVHRYITLDYSDSDEEDNPIYSYELPLSEFADGTEIHWSIKTKGILDTYSPSSTTRTITVYAPPTLELHLGEDAAKWLWDTFNFETDTIETAATGEYLECYPYDIKAVAGPNARYSQEPLCYRVSVTAEDTYETEDIFGKTKIIQAKTEVFGKTIYTSSYNLSTALEAGDVDLVDGQTYKVTVTVTMNSGLTASDSGTFTVNWFDELYEPEARITISSDNISAYIAPFCLNEYDALDDDVTLSVYRREYDGGFTEIATGITNDGVMTVVDPHPALDYARYRIVAVNKNTGVSGYSDIPGMPIKEPSIVIQWDDSWTSFDYTEEAEREIPAYSGSLVKLPYNVDVSESHEPDVSLVKYIGRKNPVSYYGTQRGETATWSTVIPKYDKETIYALRRLSAWMGDVYVREPNGIGYWAHVTVSMTINHLELTIPISLTITRVEGGM